MRDAFMASVVLLMLLGGCDRYGMAYVEIENTQGFLVQGVPIRIDPAVSVTRNDVRRSYTWSGMDVVQRIAVSRYVKIVPDEWGGPLRRPPEAKLDLPDSVYRAWREQRSYYALVEIVDARIDPLVRGETTREDVRRLLGEPVSTEPFLPHGGPDIWAYPSNRRAPYGSVLLVCFNQQDRVADLGWADYPTPDPPSPDASQ